MPTGVFGDLVVEMGVDDRKWIEGVLRIQNSSKQFSTNIAQTSSQAGAAFGRGIGQAAFAAQDFASVLSMGGPNALGRALMSTMNNVQMLGAAFGPWGMAATAAAGALGTMLLPELLKGTDQTEAFTESLKKNADALERQIKLSGDAIGFSAKVDSLRTSDPKAAETEKRSLELERTKLIRERDLVAGDFAANVERGISLGGIKNIDPANRGIFNDFGLVDSRAKLDLNEGILGKEATDKLVKEGARLAELNSTITRLGGKIFEVDTVAKGDAKDFKDTKDDFAEMVKRSAEAQRIRENISPLAAARAKLQDITGLAGGGFLEADIAEQAARNVIRDAGRSRSATSLAVGGGEFGSASGLSDVLASIRQSQGASSPELDALKQSKTVLDGILAVLRSGLKLSPPIAQEGI